MVHRDLFQDAEVRLPDRRSRLTTADRLANCIALACVPAWQLSRLMWLRRLEPAGSPASVFTHTEMALLIRSNPPPSGSQSYDINFYMTAVARLGGYLARRNDPPPGSIVLWRGFSRLADLVVGYQLGGHDGLQTCG